MINHTCPHCKRVLHIPDHHAGKSGKCTHCDQPLTVSSLAANRETIRPNDVGIRRKSVIQAYYEAHPISFPVSVVLLTLIFVGTLSFAAWLDGENYDPVRNQSSSDTTVARPAKSEVTPLPKKDVGDPDMAYVMSYEWVKDKLVSPATADFPYKPDRIEQLGENEWLISAYVDSQNRFGAMVRTDYTCRMRYEGNDAWTCHDLVLASR